MEAEEQANSYTRPSDLPMRVMVCMGYSPTQTNTQVTVILKEKKRSQAVAARAEFKASLVYRANSRTARAMQRKKK